MSRVAKQNRKTRSDEVGAILVLTAILLVVILSFAALAIDLTSAASNAQQSRQFVKLAALAALEEYNDTEGTHAEKMASALARANEVSELNLTFAMGEGEASPNEISDSGGESTLIAGKWFYAEPSGSDPCSGDYPCFIPGADESDPPNAFRISGILHKEFKPIFAGMLWGDSASIQSSVLATASVVPRHACFLVDLSPSMNRETHELGGQGSEFAFLLDEDNPGIGDGRHDRDWDDLEAGYPTRGSAATVYNEHYADDYELRTTLSDSNYYAGEDTYSNPQNYSEFHYDPSSDPQYAVNVGMNYRIDTFRDGSYNGPEPLRTVFEGLKKAIAMFKARAVAGDKICLIFYDQNLSWPRVVKLTDNFEYLESFVDWDHLLDPESGFERALQHGMFPDRSGKTNMTMAVSEAMKQFAEAQSDAVPTSDFMVLIGDGLTNCRACPELLPGMDQNGDDQVDFYDVYRPYLCEDTGATCATFCQGSNPSYLSICQTAFGGSIPASCPPPAADCSDADINNSGGIDYDDVTDWIDSYNDANGCLKEGCANSVDYHWYAINELKNLVENYVYPSRTPMHVILVGDAAAPHTVDVPSEDDPSTCMSDSEARTADIPLVKGMVDTWDCSSGSCSGTYDDGSGPQYVSDLDFRSAWNTEFFQVNAEMYDIAVMTGGIWGPIRPPGESCSPTETAPACESVEGVVDGRRMVDPYCRSSTQQIQNYMINIIGQNPYTIVEHR